MGLGEIHTCTENFWCTFIAAYAIITLFLFKHNTNLMCKYVEKNQGQKGPFPKKALSKKGPTLKHLGFIVNSGRR